MKRKSAPSALLAGLLLVAAAFAACTPETKSGTGAARADGDITVAGSTALLPLAKDASAAYQEQHKDVKISVSGGGSATGITESAANAIDIGDSDITAPEHPELHDSRVAVVGFAVATHPSAGVRGLSRQQLQALFGGKVANWKQVGGADQKVVIVNRPRNSGTRAVFAKTIMRGTPIADNGLTEDATGTVVSVVSQTPGAVTYVALGGVRPGVVVVSIDGVAPAPATIVNGTYPVWSYEHMFTLGAPKGRVADFIGFVRRQTDLVKENRFIAVGDMKVTENDR